MKEHVLRLRREGKTIAQIVKMTGYLLFDVCEIIYTQNNLEKADER